MTNKLLAEVHKEGFDGIDMISVGISTWLKGRKYFLGIALTSVGLQYLFYLALATIFGSMESVELLINERNMPMLETQQRVLMGISLLIAIIFGFIIFTLIVTTTKQVISNNTLPKREEILKETKENRGGLTTTYIISVIFLTLLFLGLIIPGVIFGVFRVFAYIVPCFHPKIKNIEALKYSKQLVQGKRRKTFGKLLVFGILRGLSIFFVLIIFAMILKFGESNGTLSIRNIIAETVSSIGETIGYIAIVALYMNYEHVYNKSNEKNSA